MPPALPAALYRKIDLPSPQQLSTYRPHLANSSAGPDLPPNVEFFGAFYFIQCTKLAMIMSDISDFYLFGSHESRHHLELKKKLDEWISVVQQVGQLARGVSIRLGFSFLSYQYHHLVVCLTRGDKPCHETCLGSARAAISLLKRLVAHSEEVFNGIIWQQLYSPFTPFFVLFGEVITNPTSKTSVEDLKVLRQTVLYFLEFQKYHTSAVKLERVAETFTKIAEAYVRHVFRKQSGMTSSDHFRISRAMILPAQPGSCPTTAFATSDFAASPATPRDTNPVGPNIRMGDHMSDERSNLDPTSLLHLLSYQGDGATPFRDLHITDIQPESLQGVQQHDAGNDNDQVLENWQRSDQNVSVRDVEMNGRNQFSHCTFDWFALEKYAI
ncbi:uncharacterized protein Z519_07329 [Cladophialophora bantiana CBS 173.52]|uniref:Transcription factor domain-containing protein n=1 Tax=Cladophialophora bantiana (strain ATCC 10958 / CBS 173.52 / CDC B-1940 / NIH 8579) TaxID=1442370 RepID=A0A0D2HNB3_CLAB1|nr:uncharacterized protein Z519_07329 [Cladophialophora bantiana CBS 173.52]KIW92345.1 hypothetical protein Z519_07329 [Cladophialophora bantiana CBS 173.52]